jgi:hypothetical protein
MAILAAPSVDTASMVGRGLGSSGCRLFYEDRCGSGAVNAKPLSVAVRPEAGAILTSSDVHIAAVDKDGLGTRVDVAQQLSGAVLPDYGSGLCIIIVFVILVFCGGGAHVAAVDEDGALVKARVIAGGK